MNYIRDISRTEAALSLLFEIKGDAQTAQAFIDRLSIFSLLANVADVKSLVIHPATTTHSQCTEEELLDRGIKPNTIRLSIGIEKVEDRSRNLDAAFKGSKIMDIDVLAIAAVAITVVLFVLLSYLEEKSIYVPVPVCISDRIDTDRFPSEQ